MSPNTAKLEYSVRDTKNVQSPKLEYSVQDMKKVQSPKLEYSVQDIKKVLSPKLESNVRDTKNEQNPKLEYSVRDIKKVQSPKLEYSVQDIKKVLSPKLEYTVQDIEKVLSPNTHSLTLWHQEHVSTQTFSRLSKRKRIAKDFRRRKFQKNKEGALYWFSLTFFKICSNALRWWLLVEWKKREHCMQSFWMKILSKEHSLWYSNMQKSWFATMLSRFSALPCLW